MAAINLSFVFQLIKTHFAVKSNLNSNIVNTHIPKAWAKIPPHNHFLCTQFFRSP